MDYRNADGSKAEMCGNGTRVFAKYLLQTGLAGIDGGLRIGTRAGVKTLTRSDDGFEVDLGGYRIESDETLVRHKGLDIARPGVGVDVGTPHVGVALSSLAALDGPHPGYPPILRPAPRHCENGGFVARSDPPVVDGEGEIPMRVSSRLRGG